MSSRDHQNLMSVAEAQDEVLSRTDLAAFGFGPKRVAAAVRAGRWRIRGSRAVVLHRGPLTRRQQLWVAVTNGGPRARLAGPTAAEEQGLTGFESEAIHIVVPKGVWVARALPGVVVHISRRLWPEDRHPARIMPTVRIERALVDAAAFSVNRRYACAILTAGVQQRLTNPRRLRRVLLEQGRIRHRGLLLAALDDIEGGSQALSELDFAKLCRRFRLPKPIRQRRRTDSTGRTRYLDVRFEFPDGFVLNVEIDDAGHRDVRQAWEDASRDLALAVRGEQTVRIPAGIIRTDPSAVANRLRPLLGCHQ